MKDDVILKVENLSKQYRLGLVGTGTISHDFNRFLARIRGKEDPYLKIGESNDRSTKGTSEYVWALKDINFEVKRGEVLGIIGKNGAGKSTLLKILSKVTGPSTGSIKANGRIASLLEVGTGFHPEMTGKENIFLNGAILGMTKNEIKLKLSEIIFFSGCERYIDTPVKRYSSGMKVRLAFAVAAFLEPDILIVDEVLAVGDAEFQKKAIGKMQDISRTDGRTVLFVSHDMVAVSNLCSRCIVLENGQVNAIGNTKEMIQFYKQLNLYKSSISYNNLNPKNLKNTFISKIEIKTTQGELSNTFEMGEPILFEISVINKIELKNIKASITIRNSDDIKIVALRSFEMTSHIYSSNQDFIFKFNLNNMKLMPDSYFVSIGLANNNETIEIISDKVNFDITKSDVYGTGKIPKGNFINFNNGAWELKNI